MTDVFLYAGEPNPSDAVLSDPTTTRTAASVTGTLATTLDGVTFAASGAETFSGAFAATLDGVTLVAAGDVSITPVTGTLATTLGDATFVAAGTAGSSVAPPAPSGASSKHWYVKYDEERRKKLKREVRSFQDMLADAAKARAEKATAALIPQRASTPAAADPEPTPEPVAVVLPSFLEAMPEAPSLPAPVFKIYSSNIPARPIIPIRLTRRIPVIPEKIRKQRMAMNTLVLALSIMED